MIASLLCAALASAQQQFAGSRYSEPRSQIQVRSTDAKPAGEEGVISIVGAVRAPDVFTTEKTRIALNELLKAAGGFAEGASTTIRIFRNGSIRYQLKYDAQQPVLLERGDIVVVVPMRDRSLKQDDLVPVICLGLVARPVCLLLEQDITTVNILTQRLLQKDEVAQAAQVFDPYGLSRQRFLLPGAIVVFDPATVDQQQLRLTQQFPPVRPLDPSEKKPASAPKAKEVTFDGLRSWPVTVQPSQTVQATPISASPQQTQSSLNLPDASAAKQPQPTALDIPSPLFSSENTVIVEPTPAPAMRSNSQGVAAPQLPPPTLHRAEPASWEIDGKPSVTASTDPEPSLADPIVTAQIASSDATTDTETAPAPPVQKPVTKRAESTSRSWGYVALTLGGLAVLCLIASVMWSQLDRESVAEFRVPRKEQAESGEDQASNKLDPSAAIIEEQILIPHQTALHGIAIGHRRIMVHERHKELAGPHFGERAKRKRQREVVQAAVPPMERESTPEPTIPKPVVETTPQVVVNSSPNEFDIVQPEPEHRAPSLDGLGPLDRALRAINKEKRG